MHLSPKRKRDMHFPQLENDLWLFCLLCCLPSSIPNSLVGHNFLSALSFCMSWVCAFICRIFSPSCLLYTMWYRSRNISCLERTMNSPYYTLFKWVHWKSASNSVSSLCMKMDYTTTFSLHLSLCLSVSFSHSHQLFPCNLVSWSFLRLASLAAVFT